MWRGRKRATPNTFLTNKQESMLSCDQQTPRIDPAPSSTVWNRDPMLGEATR
ncbi:hypothetical protein HPP92_006728 [Vanilla planifolia]|uniref:Uncharacterized protein n=1 Tax=Vanilla planifolia TaxID=51239 RepID=A0A835VAK4_VANPL|nr:hypothetical protein HPP92_006728 [Vanilla planifolia]